MDQHVEKIVNLFSGAHIMKCDKARLNYSIDLMNE